MIEEYESDLYEDDELYSETSLNGNEIDDLEFDVDEDEDEHDDEFIGEYDDPGSEIDDQDFEMMGVDEYDAEYDFDGEMESEYEYYSEMSDEEIFGFIKKAFKGIGKFIKKGARALGKIIGPIFKKLAPIAAKIVGGVIGGPAGAAIGGSIAGAVLRESEMETESDVELEFEQNEAEFESAGGDVEAYEAMEYYAAEVAEATTERRANRSLVRLARQIALTFRRNRRLKPIIPRVMRGAIALAKTFRANRKTRWAIRTIPLIVRRTLTRLSRTKGRRIVPKQVVIAMSHETAWVLANRKRAMAALRSNSRSRRRVPARRRPRRRGGLQREEMFVI